MKNTLKTIWTIALILQLVVVLLKITTVVTSHKPFFEEFDFSYLVYVASMICLFLASKDDLNKEVVRCDTNLATECRS